MRRRRVVIVVVAAIAACALVIGAAIAADGPTRVCVSSATASVGADGTIVETTTAVDCD